MLLLDELVLWVSFGPTSVFRFSQIYCVPYLSQNFTFLIVSSPFSPGFILLIPVFFPVICPSVLATCLLLWTVPFHMWLQSILARNWRPALTLDSLFLIIQSPVTKKQAQSYKSSPMQPGRENHSGYCESKVLPLTWVPAVPQNWCRHWGSKMRKPFRKTMLLELKV